MALINCPNCGNQVSDKAEKCPKCGEKLNENKRVCSECGTELNEDEKVCSNCGYVQSHTENNNDRRSLKSNSSKKKIGFLCVGIIVAIVIFSLTLNSQNVKRVVVQELDDEAPTFKNLPTELTYYVGDEVNWNGVLKESNVTVDDNRDKEIEIQLDESDIQMDTPGDYQLKLSATDQAQNEAKAEIPVHINDYETHKAYIAATTLEKDNLAKRQSGSYEYDGIHINDSELSSLEAGTLYRSISKQLEGFYLFGETLYSNWNSDIVSTVFGIEKLESFDKMKVYVDGVFQYITPNSTLPQILTWLQSCSTVSGTFDYEKAQFLFEISDLTTTASEMHITEKMLGYTLAVIEEYAPKTSFERNTYKCELQVVGNAAKEDKNVLTYEDFNMWSGDSNEFCESENIIDDEENDFKYYYELSEDDDDSEKLNIVKTNRDVEIKASFNTVLYQYGKGKEGILDLSTDLFYETIKDAPLENRPKDIDNFFKNIKSYMVYTTNDNENELVFFFNENNEIVMIFCNTYPIYS